MPNPAYFEPDPGISDAAELGYGDLYMDDGSKQFVNGDPELIAGLPPLPNQPSNDLVPNVSEQPDAGPPEDQYQPPGAQMPAAVPIPGTNHSIDPKTGQITPAGAMATSQEDVMGSMTPQMPTGAPEAQPSGGAPQMPHSVPIPGTPHSIDPTTGQITPNGAAQAQQAGTAPSTGLGSGGLQLSEREGALPAGMAAQQRNEMAGAHQETLDATTQARQQEFQIQRDAALKRAGELDAEKQAREQEIRDQQAKQSRLMAERQKVADMDIKTDLVSAQGTIGSIFSIVGAAMLGAIHSDAGLRMISESIDRNVKVQIGQRDSKLRLLSEDLGSTQQAIAAGKAQLFKIAADRAEATQKLTQADVFAAQTPAITAQLRQSQQQEEQKFDQLSIGKATEKPPAATGPKPMTEYQQARMTAQYGKAAEQQDQAQRNAERALLAIGGHWDPETQTITNKEEILKNGIPGVGFEDTMARQLSGIPAIGRIIGAADTAITSKEGLAVRAALNDLIAAKAMEQNPGRAPSDADREAASASLGLDTERGTVNAIERILRQQANQKAENAATFGPGAASQYQGRIPQGSQTTTEGQSPGAMQMAQPGSARQQLDQDRAQGPTSSVAPMQEVAGEVQKVAGRELPPEGVAILTAQAAHETGDGRHMPNNNAYGHKAVGSEPGQEFTTTEGEGANARRTTQRFRAYSSLDASIADHVDLLKRKYPEAWKALEVGDVNAYVAALKDGGYFTGSETEYLNGLRRRL